MSESKLDAGEVLDSCTGYDEDAVEAAFGSLPDQLGGARFLRAMVFVDQRRAGVADPAALKTAKSLAVKDLAERFVRHGESDLPGSPAGNGNVLSATEPGSEPPSAS